MLFSPEGLSFLSLLYSIHTSASGFICNNGQLGSILYHVFQMVLCTLCFSNVMIMELPKPNVIEFNIRLLSNFYFLLLYMLYHKENTYHIDNDIS